MNAHMMTIFFAALTWVVVGCESGSSDVGVGDVGMSDTGSAVVDTGVSVADTGVIVDDTGEDSGDVPDVVDYPEPGTVEYWLDIIPGHWEQSDPETGQAFCKTLLDGEDTCFGDLVVLELGVSGYSHKQIGCPPNAEYFIGDKTEKFFWAAAGVMCIESSLQLSFHLDDPDFGLQAIGNLEEKVISKGNCSLKADGEIFPCARNSDCVEISPNATCSGMKVQYWMRICFWHTSGSTQEGNCGTPGRNTDLYYLKTE